MHIGTAWNHPSYDLAHGQSDAVEYITHSIATLEFEAAHDCPLGSRRSN
jgi:glutamyl/glutaminyl-tRNA synthetase